MATAHNPGHLKPGNNLSSFTAVSVTDSTTESIDTPATGYTLAKGAAENFLSLQL